MEHGIADVIKHTIMITGFVFVMMLIIEYVNVLSKGDWYRNLAANRWGQYFMGGVLGIIPGCLGAFVVVAMFSHGYVTVGAVVTAMIATSGDESFIMLAMIPRMAFVIFGVLFVVGLIAGVLTDFFLRKTEFAGGKDCCHLEVHEEFSESVTISPARIIELWKDCSLARAVLALLLTGVVIAVALGQVGPPRWNWVRITLLVASAGALFIVSSVEEHFLEEHLWGHIAKKHLPKIFLWTLGILLLVFFLTEYLDFEFGSSYRWGSWLLLLAASLLGLIPQSGPHLVFLSLYAQGMIPLSVLIANSIVQDGHGMIPLLAESRRSFFVIKAINLFFGLVVGGAALAAGF